MLLLEGGRKWKTNIFKALEPTMKTEASTRRALEKCILEQWLARSSKGTLLWKDLKADVEKLGEHDSYDLLILEPSKASGQRYCGAEMSESDRNAVGQGS